MQHARFDVQAAPHMPQLVASTAVSCPLQQSGLRSLTLMPHWPRLFGSDEVSTQLLPQHVVVPVQLPAESPQKHCPFLHAAPLLHDGEQELELVTLVPLTHV